jgi:hypothetical protein
MTETEYKPHAIKKSRGRISLIVIGILIIVGGVVVYYGTSHLLSGAYSLIWWAGSGILIYLGSLFLIWGIIYPYRNRINECLYCILLLLLPTLIVYLILNLIYNWLIL